MLRTALLVTVGVVTSMACSQEADMTVLKAGVLRIGLDSAGRVVSLLDAPRGVEYVPQGRPGVLLRLTVDGKSLAPTAMTCDQAAGRLRLAYGDGGPTAEVAFAEAPTHVRFTLLSAVGAQPTQIDWGPFQTTITQTVGATVGVVRDDDFAIGIQGLNIATNAGAGRQGDISVLFGQAIEHDGGVTGSKIALFGCPAQQALATIGEIEVTEGLPHPLLDGVWGKVSPTARMPYVICPYGEGNIDEVLSVAERGGFRYVYHPGPFETWGHFRLNPTQFPDGDESLRRCAEKAARVGVRLGVHTLTSFITTNDPYVTPSPDPRLGRLGSTTLSAAIDAQAIEMPITDSTAMRADQQWGWSQKLAILGSEIVMYDGVSEAGALTGCTRGAFGTAPSAHEAGADIGRLATHSYRTVYPGIDNGMMDEMTARLVELVNRIPLYQLSFDGLEGLWSYGHGPWAAVRFVKQCYDGWQPEVMSDASGLLHYAWHVHSRMNWGELTQSAKVDVDVYRSNNCRYFEENLFPKALGWWRFGGPGGDWEATRLEDVEYLLAKAAGWDATHAMETSPGAIAGHGYGDECLRMVRTWEEAKRLGAFTAEQRARLREKGRDFHLKQTGEGRWALTEVAYSPFHWLCPGTGRRAPTDPQRDVLSFTTASEQHLGRTCRVKNPFAPQPLRFEVRALGSFDYDDVENVLLSTMPAAEFGWQKDLHEEAPRLQVRDTTVNGLAGYEVGTEYGDAERKSWATRTITRFAQPLDLRTHRGLGLWVRGDGQGELLFLELVARDCKRQYYVPIDFTGERYFEFPLGEMSLGRYYAYDWNHWSGFASWWVTLKGFDYGHVEQMTVGFNAIAPKTGVRCAVGGIKALKERAVPLARPAVQLGDRRVEFAGSVPTGGYMVYEGGDKAEVRDPSYRLLAEAAATSAPLVLPAGERELGVDYAGEGGPAPWSRWEFECEGEAEDVAAR
jgi:hypothetical protein